MSLHPVVSSAAAARIGFFDYSLVDYLLLDSIEVWRESALETKTAAI